MSPAPVRRNLVSVQVLVRYAAERGLPPARALQGTGIRVEALQDARGEISAAQELQLIRNLQRALGHLPALGLEAGLHYHLATYGIWGFTLLSCRDFRAVVEVVERYLDLSYAFIRFRFEIGAQQLSVLLDDHGLDEDVRGFLLERDFAAWSNAMRELQPQGLRVRSVQLRLPRPAHAERYRALAGVMPQFDAGENRIELDPALLDAPLPQHNAALARLCLQQCRQLLEQRQRREGCSVQVREQLFAMMARGSHRKPVLEDVAATLQLAPRSLRRRLAQEGSSFRALSDEVLEVLAEELLSLSRMKLEEVARRLGYAEPASFIRAFQRWKGVSPQDYRRQLGAPAPLHASQA